MNSLMVVDDDALFSCQFKEKLTQVLQQRRCGGYLSKE